MLYLQAASRSISRAVQGAPLPIETFKQVLDKAVHEAERAGNIISRMRQFVEKREPTRKLIEVNPVVDEAVELTLLGLRSPGRMTRRLGPGLPPVMVDPVQIQQVIVNLVRNAYEAARGRPDPAVSVTTRHEGEWVTIAVEDNGPGIAPTRVPTLFQAFSSSKRTGMGVGLSISRTIVQNHSGDLLVDPGGDGRGARFTVRLPEASPEAPAHAADDDR
jgi:two-component system, LuxR family, sensor kinase FixL